MVKKLIKKNIKKNKKKHCSHDAYKRGITYIEKICNNKTMEHTHLPYITYIALLKKYIITMVKKLKKEKLKKTLFS